ncbi:MAG: hypothetical protein ISP24_04770, partial [Rickettsiales bacterium]|nr:hypothetical protein [Rickettsiales bacterium]
MRNGKERADILATELNKHALDLHKELSKQLSKHRQLRCFVEGDDFNDKNESSLFSKYGSEETIDGYVFDIYKLQKATELYSKQDAIYNPCRDSYDVVSLARQILFDCNVFNKEKYTKLQKQVDVMLYNEIKKQIDIIIQNGNFDNDTINFLYNAYGDGNQFQLEKFDGLLAVFLETDDVYNDIESLASKILLSYGVTSSDEIDRDNSEVSYDSETERVLDNGLDIYAKEINDSNLKKEFIEQEVELKLGERKFYFEDLKYPDQNNPDCGHRKIRAFLPSETAPAGLEEINIKDRHSFETASLYASYICDQKDFRYKESTVNPALLMFKLKENGEGNFNKLKSHLYHQAMLVHVDDEIYLLRKDQEKLVSMIFPGRKITSV